MESEPQPTERNKAFVFVSRSEEETELLGKALGSRLTAGMLVGLDGTLGSGKTRLTQGICKAIGIADDTVVSPTFTICVPYYGRLELWHMDAYRITSLDEVDELGLDEALEEGVVLIVEWAERILEALPTPDLRVEIEPTGETARKFTLTPLTEAGKGIVFGEMGLEAGDIRG